MVINRGLSTLTALAVEVKADEVNRAKRSPTPADRQPWDPANGLRVGVVAGGLLGAALLAVTGFANFWVVGLAGAVGGAVGFWSEKRKQPDRSRPPNPDAGPRR